MAAGVSTFALLAALPASASELHTVPAAQGDGSVDEVTVVGDPVGLLEDRPTDSVFGLGRSSLETPRSLSIVSDTTIDRYAIEDIDDLITTTPGTYGGSFFGLPGAVTIRGDRSETYFRGFKRAVNNGLFPTPIGASERIEIIRGPVPVIYGAGRVGGILNFYPNTAKGEGKTSADGASGSLAVTGGSYDKLNGAGEVYLPFLLGGRETGLSLYGEIEDSESFYRGREPKHQLVQAAFNHDFGSGWSVEVGGMYFNSEDYFQTPGWNRLTQDLIDSGTYITGVDTEIPDTNGDGQLNPSEIDAVVGTFFGASNIRTLVDFGVFAFPTPYALDSGVGTTTLDPRTVFISDREIQNAENLTLYGDVIKEFDNSTLKLQLFYDDVDGQLYVSYGFAAEHVMQVFEARASYDFNLALSDLVSVDVFTTASYRNYDSELREQFLAGYLVLDRRDLSAGATATDIFATPLTDSTIPWDSDFDSEWSDLGAALVADIKFGDHLSLVLGGRYDQYDVEASDAGVTTFGAPTFGESDDGDFSYSASLNYTFDAGLVPYITYAEGSSPQLNSNGGISPSSAASDQILADSELFEVGIKWSLLNGSLNGSLAYYDQARNITDPFGNVDEEVSEGIEFELRYLITDNWTLTGAATFQEFEITAPGAGQGEYVVLPPTNPAVDLFGGGTFITDPADGYGGLWAALNAGSLPELVNGYDRKTIPDTVVSSFLTYTSDPINGVTLGGTIGATYVSETGGKTITAVTLPDYTVARAALFGEYDRFSVTATVDNVFDEEYFQPVQGVYEEVAALPGTGRIVRVTAKVAF